VRWPGSSSVRDRSWRLIALTRDFDAWLIAWPGGTAADLHDHGGSRGALHVIAGSLVESMPWPDDQGSLTFARREVHSGATLAFGAGHVHDVRNESAELALSLHVYSPPLQSMSYYDRSGDLLVPRETGPVPRRDHTSPDDRPISRFATP
jgi:predicted metal-dependent enzyme (double-stranded beta helix superfamily)